MVPQTSTQSANVVFVVGPQRTGTTWIYEWLSQQDGVYLDRIEKENYFFSHSGDEPEKNRNNFLAKLTGTGVPVCYADVCSTYFAHPQEIERIYLAFPESKMIYIRRDEESRKKSFEGHRNFNRLATWLIGYRISWELYNKQAQFDLAEQQIGEIYPAENTLRLEFEDLKKTGGKTWTQQINQFMDTSFPFVEMGMVNKNRKDSSWLKKLTFLGIRLIQKTRLHIAVKRISLWMNRA